MTLALLHLDSQSENECFLSPDLSSLLKHPQSRLREPLLSRHARSLLAFAPACLGGEKPDSLPFPLLSLHEGPHTHIKRLNEGK